MAAIPGSKVFHRSVYRDFTWFALAAIGVGLAVSLALATLIVLASPSPDRASREEAIAGSAQAHPRAAIDAAQPA